MPIFDLNIFDPSFPAPQGMFDSEILIPVRPTVISVAVHGNVPLSPAIHPKNSKAYIHGNEVITVA